MAASGTLAWTDTAALGAGCGVFGVVAVLLLWSTIAGRDLWPFSHYPMFAGELDGSAVRFFRLRMQQSGGRAVELGGLADALVDPFHRACEELWRSGSPSSTVVDALALRTWGEACRLAPALAAAESVEVVLHVAQVLADGRVMVGGKVVHHMTTGVRPTAE